MTFAFTFLHWHIRDPVSAISTNYGKHTQHSQHQGAVHPEKEPEWCIRHQHGDPRRRGRFDTSGITLTRLASVFPRRKLRGDFRKFGRWPFPARARLPAAIARFGFKIWAGRARFPAKSNQAYPQSRHNSCPISRSGPLARHQAPTPRCNGSCLGSTQAHGLAC
jgi:hypothetical protein